MVFAKDADKYLTIEYYGGNEKKIIFHMDVTTGNILEIDENGSFVKWQRRNILSTIYNESMA